MENPTPFSLSEAIRRWRAEFGSPSPLNAADVNKVNCGLKSLDGCRLSCMIASMSTLVIGARRRTTLVFTDLIPEEPSNLAHRLIVNHQRRAAPTAFRTFVSRRKKG